jgi:hypothetical protein
MNAVTDAVLLQVVFGHTGLLTWLAVNVTLGLMLILLARLFDSRGLRALRDDRHA